MLLRVVIRRNLDNKEVVYEDEYVGDNDIGGIIYNWRDGNFGCDCNRHLLFERVLGNSPDTDEVDCGEELYTVPYAILSDGTRVNIDDR